MPEPTVREQQTKCKDLRKHLVDYVKTITAECQRIRALFKARRDAGVMRPEEQACLEELEEHGDWTLGGAIADNMLRILKAKGIHTFSNVLSKELRKAERLGEIQKRKRPGTVYVEYTACVPSGMLLDNSPPKHHNQ